MTNVTFSKKIFEKDIGKIDEKMQERIAMFGTTVEEMGNEEITIDVSPNRPDLLSYHGFRRSFLAFLGKKTGLMKYKLNPPEKNYQVLADSSVKNVRPFTVCAIVKDLKLDDEKIKEIIDVQEKLHATLGRKRKKVAIGIYPLEKIKLPITFKALEPDKIKFIPLESEKEMSGLEILQKHPAGKEYAHLLAGKEKFPVFSDADGKILSMPPIINSQTTGKVTEKTKDVFVECSGFDVNSLKKTLNILVTTLADMNGKVFQMELKSGYITRKEITPSLEPEEMKISIENTNRTLGLNLNEKQLKEFLEKAGYEYNKGSVKIPAWRTDVLHEVDLIEDVAIAYGYENFIPEIPEISTIGAEDYGEVLKRKISEILSGLGMLEVSSYHLTTKDEQFSKMDIQEKNFIRLDGSKTEYNILRENLSHYLLKIFSENVDSEYPQKIFEIGKVFGKKNKIEEKENFAAAISSGNFTEIKQIAENLGKMLDIEISIKESDKNIPFLIEGRAAKLIAGEKEIGIIGEVHPKILKNWKLKMPVALFEIDFSCLAEMIAKRNL
ncbi:phenylalanine--tRNA ligase subunit beta [Candidatus Pacearchaeota archaeon]|nr:phenylalanine--tRNA ligase subunit beta [Candidatus Pacearchaeota archaeon]